jgi:two-component system chemotaxis response regulator CheB
MLAQRPSSSIISLDRPQYGAQIKVLVVDDSSFMRSYLTNRLESFRRITVVGAACNGLEALDMARQLRPDVITLDIQMPRLNGLDTLEQLMRETPTRVLMLSSLTIGNAEATIEALHRGAIDVIAKPRASGVISEEFINEVVDKIEAVAAKPLRVPIRPDSGPESAIPRQRQALPLREARHLVVIGTSTGGPSALNEVIPALPADLDAAYLIIQHMPPNFTRSLAQRINRSSQLLVKEADNADPLRTGMALVAPGDYHLLLDSQRRVILDRGEKLNGVRPSVDVTMEQVAPMFGNRLCGVILTGMGSDGTRGARQIRRYQGHVIVQDEATSVVYGMPGSVARAGYANAEVPIERVAAEIVKWRATLT